MTGTPGATDSALSVAQTAVPGAFLPLMQILEPASIRRNVPAVFQSWSKPLTAPLQGSVQYGNGAGGNLNGCASFPAGSLTGKVVLVDRGACDFTLKISNIADGNGLDGIIGLIAPGDPFEGGVGAGEPSRITGFMISQANSLPSRGSRTRWFASTRCRRAAQGQHHRLLVARTTAREHATDQAGDRGAWRIGVGRCRLRDGYRAVRRHLGCGSDGDRFRGIAPRGLRRREDDGEGHASGNAIGLGLKPTEVKASS